MRRVLGLAVTAIVLYLALSTLADFTKAHHEPTAPDSATVIVFDVATRRATMSEPAAVAALWGVCALHVGGARVSGPVSDPDGYAVELRPGLGPHAVRRLTGCLEDALIDRVLGTIVSVDQRTGSPAT